MITLGQMVRHQRLQLKLTQRQVAYRTDVEEGLIDDVENDRYMPTRTFLVLLAGVLELPLQDVLSLVPVL